MDPTYFPRAPPRPQNRINRLLIEQERASKRITETRRRTEEIMKLKERNTQHQMAQQDASAWLVSEQELQKELLQQDRAQRSTAIATSRQTMYSMRKEEVSVLKQMRSENERAVQEQRALEYERAKERKQVVRSSQKEALGRKFQEQQKAVEENRRKREQARQELDDDALSHLEAYTGLAAEEQRLIASLQKWQDVQDDAFTQLDGVMSGSGKARHGSRPVSRSTAGALTPREPATPVADGAA